MNNNKSQEHPSSNIMARILHNPFHEVDVTKLDNDGIEEVFQMGIRRRHAGVFVDHEGCRDYSEALDLNDKIIGTVRNLMKASENVVHWIEEWAGGNYGRGDLIRAIEEYKATRYCCECDTHVFDNDINTRLDTDTPWDQDVEEYKLIN